MKTIADGLAQRHDNFKLLRLFAASLVIYGHSHTLAMNQRVGQDWVTRTIGGTYTGEIAVWIFFVLSGFLVTGSWMRLQSVKDFLLARLRRLWPGLLFCLVVCTLVFGFAYSSLAPRAFFLHPQTWHYNYGAALYYDIQFNLPGVFEASHNRAINGSLWTLPLEVIAYVGVGIIGGLGLLQRSRARATAATLGAVAFAYASIYLGWVTYSYNDAALGVAFASGVLIFLYAEEIPLNVIYVLLLAALVVWLGGAMGRVVPHWEYQRWAWIAFLAYTTFYVGYALPVVPGQEKIGDYSYGVYLFGWPVQQIIAHARPDFDANLLAIASLIAVMPIAIVSWHLVEKRFIKSHRRNLLQSDWLTSR